EQNMQKIINNLKRSQKSYKFIVYKAFVDLASEDGKLNKTELFDYVRYFYLSLKNNGFLCETKHTDSSILDIENTELEALGKYLEGMPIERIDTLIINSDLIEYTDDWSKIDKRELNEFLNNKLIAYYENKLDQDISNFLEIFRIVTKKEVAKTLFSDGFIVDMKYHKEFDSILGRLEVGSTVEIEIEFNEKQYNCRMRNVVQNNRKKELYRISFRKNLKEELNKLYPYYFDYLDSKNESDKNKYYTLMYSGVDNKFKLFIVDNRLFIKDKIWLISKFYKEIIKTENFKGHPIKTIIKNDLPKIIENILYHKYGEKFDFLGSADIGRWATVPWTGLKTDNDVGMGYLYSNKKDEIYLNSCFIMNKFENLDLLEKRKQYIYSKIKNNNLLKNIEKLSDTGVGAKYDDAIIYAKKYNSENLPSEEIIEKDLMEMLKMHEKISKLDQINKINLYINQKGFHYPSGIIENFYLSLKSKPFVLLAGISGTGKTKLVELFSKSIGYEFEIIPVKPDWNDMSDLLGYKDIKGDFIKGKLFKVIVEAIDNPSVGHIVCLDEMNLARVEYYFSDILSLMETKNENFESKCFDLDLGKDNENDKKIYIPNNLYFVGTVNMDETTHPFSKKVLDRANTIEFSEVTLDNLPFNNVSDGVDYKSSLDNSFLKTNYLILKDIEKEYHDFIENKVVANLISINKVLKENNLHVGYRVRDEISFYMVQNEKLKLLDYEIAFDYQIMQKILPRIQGSSKAIKELLIKLYIEVGGKIKDIDDYNIADQIKKDLNENKSAKDDKHIKYIKSAEKIYYMIKNYEDDGFTAYWL
ncbi:MAG: DUF3578 domain-containing protein, partial [Bacillota bacterium]|nr:DUF3578 domain-containing protein [Bacillota bacterium]